LSLAKEIAALMPIAGRIFTEYEYLPSMGRYSYFLQFLPGPGDYNHSFAKWLFLYFALGKTKNAGEHTP
jgi:hypothetical protein